MQNERDTKHTGISRRTFLGAGAAAGAAVLTLGRRTQAAAPPKRPNILLFVADDQGRFFTSCYGNPVMNTPNMDRLAREGLRFDQAFTPSSICAPSRSVLYSGLYPHRNGAHTQGGRARPGTRTLPHHMESLGYKVALAGKDHVSPDSIFAFNFLETGNEHFDIPLLEDFIAGAGDDPFCLIVASKEPHTPHDSGGYEPGELVLPGYFVDTPETRERVANYCTDINHVDQELGDVMDMLERLGHADNTLVMFTSDHGEPMPYCKWTCYDGGIQIPFLAWWPGVVEPGRVTDANICFTDVLPTMVDVAGGNPDPGLDGRSFLPVLTGERDTHLDAVFANHTHKDVRNGCRYPIRAVRMEGFKYIVNVEYETTFTNNVTEGAHDFDLVWNSWVKKAETDPFAADRVRGYQHRPLEELYDLENDPCELNNVADRPEHHARIARMRRRLLGWMAQQGDEELGRVRQQFR